MSFAEQAQELDAELRSTIERAVDDLRTELRRRFEESLEGVRLSLPESLISEDRWSALVEPAVEAALAERAPEPAEPAAADATELRDALTRLDAARTQADVLRTLVGEAARFASRTAVFLVRGGSVRGWGDQGLGVDWSQQAVDPSSEIWQRLLEGTGAQILSSSQRADLANRWDAAVASEAALIPLVLRDRVAAALYVDRVGDDDLDVPALQTLTYVGALAIETLPLRERPATSTLILEAPPEPVEPVEVEEAEALPEPTETVEPVAPTPEPADAAPPTPVEDVPSAPEPELEPGVEPEAEMEMEEEEPEPAVSEDTDFGAADLGEVDLEIEEEPAPAATESIPMETEADEEAAWVVEEEEPEAPAAEEPAAEPVPQPVESAPEPPPPGAAPPPPPGGTPEETQQASAPAGETPQVRPPEDVQGPGWAFSSTPQQKMDDEEEARHEEARRLARLLISEIKLYNEDQVQEGRKNNDVAERLKEDIDRSRQLYEERVDPRVRDTTDYFYQEMVRLLGAGDPKTLGI